MRIIDNEAMDSNIARIGELDIVFAKAKNG
jgi:hypothetical protein